MRKLIFALAALCIAQAGITQAPEPHSVDGILNEWDSTHFVTDNETHIAYSVANDNNYLYVAVKVKDRTAQMKMCRMGMTMFVDARGKKRENMGLSYPVPFQNFNSAPAGDGGRPDENAMRDRLAASLVFYKTLGIEGHEDGKMTPAGSSSEGIMVMGGWNEKNELTIEYALPVDAFGSLDKLANKEISIGFKVNGAASPGESADAPASAGISRSGGSSSRSGGGGGRGNRGGSGSSEVFASMREQMGKEESAWTKYTIKKN